MTEINKNYVCYHLHTDLSLLDSCTKAKDYVELAVKLGQKAIAFKSKYATKWALNTYTALNVI